jgi:hypothetical protein
MRLYSSRSTEMPYDAVLTERARRALAGRAVTERKMMGGLAFLLGGHMCCGVLGEDRVVRIGPEQYEAALAEPHVRPMDFTGRAMRDFVYVAADGTGRDEALAAWLDRATTFTSSLPPKS